MSAGEDRDGAGATTRESSLALGAFLDGVPEQLVLGLGLAGGGRVSIAVAVVCTLSGSVGFAIADSMSGNLQAAVDSFAIANALASV